MPPSTLTLNDGNKIPWLAFEADAAERRSDAVQTTTIAIQSGLTHIYGNGDTIRDSIIASGKQRSELYITMKLQSELGPGQTPKNVLEKWLEKLRVTYVDLYLIMPCCAKDKLKEIWKSMEEAKLAGLTKSIGVSNSVADGLNRILSMATIPPAVNEIEAHPCVWEMRAPTLEVHKKHGILTAAFHCVSPLRHEMDPGPLGKVVKKVRARLEAERRCAVTDEQVLIKWLQQRGVLVMIMSSCITDIRLHLDTKHIPALTSEEIKLIDVAGAKNPKTYLIRTFPQKMGFSTDPQYNPGQPGDSRDET